MSGNAASVRTLRLALLALCCLPLLSLVAGESWWRTARASESRGTTRARRSQQPHLFQFGQSSYLACMVVPDDGTVAGEDLERGSTSTRISNTRRRPSSGTRRPTTSRPRTQRPDFCPNGVTYFDGCNSCSCGTDQLCTLKACNRDTTVDIFDPCTRVTCGYHQRCQAICVGQVCKLKPLCVSDDSPDCHNCPWLCVDERLNCSDHFGSRRCKPTLACYRRKD